MEFDNANAAGGLLRPPRQGSRVTVAHTMALPTPPEHPPPHPSRSCSPPPAMERHDVRRMSAPVSQSGSPGQALVEPAALQLRRRNSHENGCGGSAAEHFVAGAERAGAMFPWATMGPASAATSSEGPSDNFARWIVYLERTTEERLLHEARRRFCCWDSAASLEDFRRWLTAASTAADEATLDTMRRLQLKSWLLCVKRKMRAGSPQDEYCATVLPEEVRDRIESFIGGRHIWGPINASRARAVAESALRQLRRCEGIMRAAALAAIVARYVHPTVVQAAEAGYMHCSTEIPTDDVALQALFQASSQTGHDVGAALAAHLAIDGFEVDSKYHDPEYGLWRGFWVDQCSRLRLTLMW
eukprot:TRINITY_DN18577_c0_g1_i1.p1 TRINITY_DN18577_c0_g1~~TRINITY_DN18577_c0_g1_i1.p1  ORF type:complete len:357 (+),score=65.77 TRINITY_DN18577_c0_g1_i1:58-1128(+)